ncbi:MAG TPA: PilZ domain-containing protein [Terriglobia bacterium]|nr:PilZ domain-containing protein [Terriglobia bacterium]
MTSERKPNSRVFRRTTTLIPVVLFPRGQRPKIQDPASVLQTSFLGLRVRTAANLKQGQAVHIVRLTGPCDSVPARVIWVSKQDTEKHRQAGLQFTDPMRARITPN